MKHARILRTLAALLALVLMLSACSGAAEPIATGTSEPETSNATDTTDSSEPVKLTYFVDSMGDCVIQSFNENLMYQEIEKILNIDLEFQHSTKGQF